MPADREFDLVSRRKVSLGERARQLLFAATETRTRRAYREMFLKPNSDELSEAGARVLADMAKAAGLGTYRLGQSDEYLREREGRRGLLMHVLNRLDGANFKRAAARLTKLQQHKREENDDD